MSVAPYSLYGNPVFSPNWDGDFTLCNESLQGALSFIAHIGCPTSKPCFIWTSLHGKETREIFISSEMPWIMMFLMAMIDFFPRYLLGVQVAINAKSTHLSGLPQFSEMICRAYASKTALKMQRLEGPLILGIFISFWGGQNDEENPWIFRNLLKFKKTGIPRNQWRFTAMYEQSSIVTLYPADVFFGHG